jgi:hypothetical protein
VPEPLSLYVAGPVVCAGSFNADSKIPRVTVLYERQAHHAPEFRGSRLEIQCVDVRVAATSTGAGPAVGFDADSLARALPHIPFGT